MTEEEIPPPGIDNLEQKVAGLKVEDKAGEQQQQEGQQQQYEGHQQQYEGQQQQQEGEQQQQEEEEVEDYNEEQQNQSQDVAKIDENVDDSLYKSDLTFEDLEIREDLLKGIYVEMQFEKPSQIQVKTLPVILKPPYPDLIAQAQNGSGKTTCFSLAMLQLVDPNEQKPQALCLCPTRELGVQNLSILKRMGKYASNLSYTSTSANDYDQNNSDDSKIVDQVIVGTVGTLKRWINLGQLSVDYLKILVLDEADEMLGKGGFRDDCFRIIRKIQSTQKRKKIQNMQLLLFSATYNDEVREFAAELLPDAKKVYIPPEQLTLDKIKQYQVVFDYEAEKQPYLVEQILEKCENIGQTIIFTKYREQAQRLYEELTAQNYTCLVMQGGMSGEERDRAIDKFRKSVVRIMIATNVLSRGFDVSSVTLVVNFALPTYPKPNNNKADCETYIHRIGRTGRFGRKGIAFNFVTNNKWDKSVIDQIQDHFQIEIPVLDQYNEESLTKALKRAGLT